MRHHWVRAGLCAAAFLCAIPAVVAAQPTGPRAVSRQLARSKAERMARLSQAVSEQTLNQTLYDVTFYHLDLTLEPTIATIAGTVEMHAEALAGLTEIDLDLLANMTVVSVTSGGTATTYNHNGDILTITLDRPYATGETVVVTVQYYGTPNPSVGAFGFDNHNGQPMIWSLSEPFGARSWWPCKDVPSDKADSVDVVVTVPNNLIVASNGSLESVTGGSTTDTYWWEERYPISTYLVSLAIHPYTTYSDWYHYSLTDSMEVAYYVFPDHLTSVKPTYALTVPMIETFAGLFGEYPFVDEKYGHAEFLWGGGMEHQTITSLGGWSEYLIAHELAHQWFGDMITCNDFHHIWLNEGFASYCEALWSESAYGEATYHAVMANARYLGPGTIYVPDTSDWTRIFHSGLSYDKASWVLHMLRHVVGDSAFFNILQAYYADTRYQYGTATTEEFRDVCESVSGMDLDFFFHQWIYEEFYPSYQFEWSSAPTGLGSYDVTVTIDQLQTSYIFKMPVDLTVTTGMGDTTFVVWDSLATQTFVLTVDDEPTAVLLDKDNWILRTVEEQIAAPTFDRGILLVNGVDFDVYGAEIWTAYQDSVFWGDYDVTFWDCFDETASGYPANLPAPLGHGAVPADTIEQFSTVIWVGNNYNGDIGAWYDTPILSFLNAGGNVVLLTRLGQDFLTEPLRDYLGITWRELPANTLGSCVSAYSGLVNMGLIGTQSYCALFDTQLATPESERLFVDTSFSPTRALGAWRKPAGGGTHRAIGGKFVFLSGRPYRYNHGHLRANMEFILGEFLDEPYSPPTGTSKPAFRYAFGLGQNYPNPFNPTTTIRFTLPRKDRVELRVYSVRGALVTTIAAGDFVAGPHKLTWDGTDDDGHRVATGVYFCRLRSGGRTATRKMLLLK